MALGENLAGLFTTNPVNKVGPTGQPLIGGSNTMDLLTRSAGGLLGREVRGRPEQLTAALSQIDPKAPDAKEQQLRILAQLGTPPQQMQAIQQLEQRGVTKAGKEQEQRFRASLITRNEALGENRDRSESITNASPEMLADIRKEILSEEREAALKNRGNKGRYAIGAAAGLSSAQVLTYSNLNDKQFADVVSAQESDDVMMKDAQGNLATYRVNKFSMVNVEDAKTGVNKWVTPESLNLLQAPKETRALNQASELSSALTKAGVTSFVDLTEQARTANRTLALNEEGRAILDQGILTGSVLAAPLNQVLLVAKAFGATGEAIDSAENAQAYIASRVVEIGNAIQMFGSGTALSDNDAKLAADAAAGKLEMTEANMRALMKLADRAARKKLEIHKQVYDSYAETATPASLAAFTVTPFSSGLNNTARAYIPKAGDEE